MRALWRLLRGRRAPRELDDEERAARAVEREHRERAQRQGEAFIRTYAEPAASWRPPEDARREE